MKNPLVQIRKAVAHLGAKRSPHWPAVRHRHLVREGWCRACGGTTDLEVHHVISFHERPALELDDNNLITLCERIGKQCHLKRGHLGNWKSTNPRIREEAKVAAPGTVGESHAAVTLSARS